MDLTITLIKSKGLDENGKEKTEKKVYHAPSPKLGIVKETLVLLEENKLSMTKAENMDNLVKHVVKIFGNQFKAEDVYDQLEAENAQNTLLGYINSIISTLGLKVQQMPPNQTAAK